MFLLCNSNEIANAHKMYYTLCVKPLNVWMQILNCFLGNILDFILYCVCLVVARLRGSLEKTPNAAKVERSVVPFFSFFFNYLRIVLIVFFVLFCFHSLSLLSDD